MKRLSGWISSLLSSLWDSLLSSLTAGGVGYLPCQLSITHSQAGTRAVSSNSFSADPPGAFLLFFPETGFKAHLIKEALTEALGGGVPTCTFSNTGHAGLQCFPPVGEGSLSPTAFENKMSTRAWEGLVLGYTLEISPASSQFTGYYTQTTASSGSCPPASLGVQAWLIDD